MRFVCGEDKRKDMQRRTDEYNSDSFHRRCPEVRLAYTEAKYNELVYKERALKEQARELLYSSRAAQDRDKHNGPYRRRSYEGL